MIPWCNMVITFWIVVRGFVTGSTDTSLWTVYKNGVRNYCGNVLPEGMFSLSFCLFPFKISLTDPRNRLSTIIGLVKNQKLSSHILTPTTKADTHDVPVTPDEVYPSAMSL